MAFYLLRGWEGGQRLQVPFDNVTEWARGEVETRYEPAHKMLVVIALSRYEGSDEPAQMCRLA